MRENLTTPQPSAAFTESVRLLSALHELFLRGQDQSPQADALREQMEQPWYAMTAEEQSSVEQLSVDLYATTQADPSPREPAV